MNKDHYSCSKKKSQTEPPLIQKFVFRSLILPNKEDFQIKTADLQIWLQGDGWVTELKSHLLINHVKRLYCSLLDNRRIYICQVWCIRGVLCASGEASWAEEIATESTKTDGKSRYCRRSRENTDRIMLYRLYSYKFKGTVRSFGSYTHITIFNHNI